MMVLCKYLGNIMSQILKSFLLFALLQAYPLAALSDDSYRLTPIPSDRAELKRAIAVDDAVLKQMNSHEQRRHALYKLNYAIHKDISEDELSAAIDSVMHLDGYKSDPELLAALGAAYSFRASFYPKDISKASSWFSKGTRMMDKAISIDSKNVGARIYRAIAAINTPKFLNRTNIAISDLNFLLNDKKMQPMDPELKRFVVTNLAKAYEISGDKIANDKLQSQYPDIFK